MKKTLAMIALTLMTTTSQAAGTASEKAINAFLSKGDLACLATEVSLPTTELQREYFAKKGLGALITNRSKRVAIDTGAISGPNALFSFDYDTDFSVIKGNVVEVFSANPYLTEGELFRTKAMTGARGNTPVFKIHKNTFVHVPSEDAFYTANVHVSCGYGSCGVNDFIIFKCQ